MWHNYFWIYFIECADITGSLGKDFLDKKIDNFNKEYITGEDLVITLTSNDIKDIMKVIKSLENRGTTRKITIQAGGFLSFFRSLMTTGLLLMKSVLTTLAKSGLLLLALIAEMSTTDAAIQEKILGPETTALIISNEEMEDTTKISQKIRFTDKRSNWNN